jgi:hypothetical protein
VYRYSTLDGAHVHKSLRVVADLALEVFSLDLGMTPPVMRFIRSDPHGKTVESPYEINGFARAHPEGIFILASLDLRDAVKTVAHELAHVQQYRMGQHGDECRAKIQELETWETVWQVRSGNSARDFIAALGQIGVKAALGRGRFESVDHYVRLATY